MVGSCIQVDDGGSVDDEGQRESSTETTLSRHGQRHTRATWRWSRILWEDFGRVNACPQTGMTPTIPDAMIEKSKPV
jgi:hypothetical protein